MPDHDLPLILPKLLPRLWRFAIRLARHQQDAEDLVQRTCVRALERRHQYQEGSAVLSWLFSIMHSIWLNEIRTRQVRRNGQLEWDDDSIELIDNGMEGNPEHDLFYRQVIAAVEALPEAQRSVMLLVAVEGLSYREAAEILDIPLGTIMSRLARARISIGEKFNPHSTESHSSEKSS